MIQIRIANLEDKASWDDYVLHHPLGLAYHLFGWGEAVKEAYGFDPCYLLAEEEGEIVGILPMVDFKVPLLGRSLVSLPYCDIGGCLADNDELALALKGQAREIGQNNKVKKIELRQSAAKKDVTGKTKVRMILELPESSEVLLAGFKSKLRSQVMKPIRDGLTCQLGGQDLVGEFYQVFRENMRDLGSPVHSYRWIESIVNGYDENAKVGVVATPEGMLAAAGIILYTETTVSIPWASSLIKFNRLNPNMLLYWSFLSFAADNGFSRFDFGRSTIGEGTFNFKKQWGAQPVSLEWVDLLNTSPSDFTGSSRSRKKLENIWKKMPIMVATTVGPKLRRYISL